MDFHALIQERYSCRSFAPTPVEQEKLDKILEAARVAPTAKNLQPQRYLVVTEAEALAKMDEVTTCRFGAPLVLVVCYDRNAAHETSYHYMSADMDCTISATHAMLAANAEGLETIWLLRFDPERCRERFELPEHIVPLCLLAIGYPSEKAVPSPRHAQRMSIEEMVTYEHF